MGPSLDPFGRKKLITDKGPCLEWLNVLQAFRLQLTCSGIPCMLKAKAVCKRLKNAPLLTVRAPGICYCLGQPGNFQRDATFLFTEVFSRTQIPQQGRQFQRKKIKGTDLLMKCQNSHILLFHFRACHPSLFQPQKPLTIHSSVSETQNTGKVYRFQILSLKIFCSFSSSSHNDRAKKKRNLKGTVWGFSKYTPLFRIRR